MLDSLCSSTAGAVAPSAVARGQQHAAAPITGRIPGGAPGARAAAGKLADGSPINSAGVNATATRGSLALTPGFIPGIAPCLPARTRPAAPGRRRGPSPRSGLGRVQLLASASTV